MFYTYKMLCDDIEKFSRRHVGAQIFSVGESVESRQLMCIRLGNGRRRLFINGAHHGLESITSALIMRFCTDFATAIEKGECFFGSDARAISECVTLYALPMVNPDGVEMAVNGADFLNPFHRDVIRRSGVIDFTGIWQANVRGVDINHNYDAGWHCIKKSPSPTRWGGEYPESEPETRAVTALVRRCGFDMLIAFHSQGGEIYYDFNGAVAPRSVEIAGELARVSGYKAEIPTGTAAFGGCKDWFIKEFGREGFTIEVGHGKNPLPLELLSDIYEENARIVLRAMELC